jgi:hypothetical protein
MENEFDDVPVAVRLAETPKWLKVSERKVWQMGKDGLIRRHREGRCVLYFVREYLKKWSVGDGLSHS